MSDAKTFTMTLRVTSAHIDPQGHVNNVSFVGFVQDAAVAHWFAVAPAELRDAFAWVVRRHEIEYFRPGWPDDELLVRTWVGEPSGATWERFTEISRASDGQILVKARTVWVLLDAASGRPRRIDARIAASLTPPADPGDSPSR